LPLYRTAVPESPSVPNFPFLRVRRKRGPDVISLAFSQASSASAAEALEAWLKASGIASGPLFRRILKNGKLGSDGLSGTAVRDLVKARCALAGVERISRRIRCDRDS